MRPILLLRLLLLATGLLLSDVITIERIDTCPDEQLPSLIGMPLPYRTSIPWVNSGSGVLYVQGLLVDLLIWWMVVGGMAWGLGRVVPEGVRRSVVTKILSWSITSLAVLVIIFIFAAIEWRWQWAPDLPFRCTESTLRSLWSLE